MAALQHDGLEHWSHRWRATGLSARDAALWTEIAGCRPEVALELRAAGVTPERLQRCAAEWASEPGLDVTVMADVLLAWVRKGFSWPEIEKARAWLSSDDELRVECELRSRGIPEAAYWNDVEIDGQTIALWDFLMSGQPDDLQALDARVARLERSGCIPGWSSALA